MFESKVEKAEEIFEQAVKRMIYCEQAALAFYGLIERRPVDDDSITMRLNTESGSIIYLDYNPDFVLSFGMIEKGYSILSAFVYVECLRVALHHCTTRACKPYEIFKLSSDLLCFENAMSLVEVNKETMALVKVMFPTIQNYLPILKKHKFDKEKDFFLERVFSIFMKEQDDEKNKSSSNGSSASDSSDNGSKSDSSNGDNSDDTQSDSSGSRAVSDAIKQHLSIENAPKSTEKWNENTIINERINQKADEVISNHSYFGTLTPALKMAILNANKKEYNPASLIKGFANSIMCERRYETPMRVHRRFGTDWPGYRNEFKPRVVFAFDASGSVSNTMLEWACTISRSFFSQCEVYYCFWDTKCTEVIEMKKKVQRMDCEGRGCTDPMVVLDKLNEPKNKRKQFDAVVYVTDCEFNMEKPKSSKKFMFIQTKGSMPAPEWASRVVSYDDMEKLAK